MIGFHRILERWLEVVFPADAAIAHLEIYENWRAGIGPARLRDGTERTGAPVPRPKDVILERNRLFSNESDGMIARFEGTMEISA